MAKVSVSYGWQLVTAVVPTVVGKMNGAVFVAPAGATDLNAGKPLKKIDILPAGASISVRGPGNIDVSDFVDPNVPASFAAAGWSVADAAAANAATVTLVTIPSVGNSVLVAIEWSIDAGVTWTALTRKTAGTEDIPCGSTGLKTVLLRVSSQQGYSGSSSKTVTVA